MNLEQAFDAFVKNGKYLRGWSPRTAHTYYQGFRSFQTSLPELTREDLPTKANLEAWVIQLKDKGLTPGGINMYIRTINSFLSWLLEEKLIEQSIRLKLLPNPCKPLKGFSDNEIRSLLSFRPTGYFLKRTHVLICLLLDTGIRIDEALNSMRSKCDFDNLLLTVCGKGNKERIVPFSQELRKTLWSFNQRNHINSPYLFCTRSGLKLSYRNTFRDIKNLCAKAGVEGSHVHPHAFRHHFATTYIRRGGDIYRLSRILGHTSISTTQLYLRSMGIEQIGENHSSLSPLSRI